MLISARNWLTILTLAAAWLSGAAAAACATDPVSGVFKGNGKEAKLAFVSVRRGEPFSGKPSLELIFTEKDHSREKRPDIKAAFGDFGSALLLSVHEDGGIFGCQVAHAAHAKKPFSSIGKIKTADFKVEGGKVSGQITTGGQTETFGETWEVDLKFEAPFKDVAAPPAKTAAASPAEQPTRPAPKAQPRPLPQSDRATDRPAAAAAIKVGDLPLPKDATDIEFKKLVEHVAFKSPADVSGLAATMSKSLDEQGWKKASPDLVTPQSAILVRTKGEAMLTLMLKPAAKGSQATIFTTGLSWEGK